MGGENEGGEGRGSDGKGGEGVLECPNPELASLYYGGKFRVHIPYKSNTTD